jgi:hypothetical protein
MTKDRHIAESMGSNGPQATWIATADLRLRVRPAELARILGVTRQAVAKAIKAGRVRVDADGLVDPHRATREWIANTHPGSMRARVLRDAAIAERSATEQARYWQAEAEAARQSLAESEASERERARAIRTACRFAISDALASALPGLASDLVCAAVALAEKHNGDRLRRAIDRGVFAQLLYRRAWRVLEPALAASIAEDAAHAAAPADPYPAAAAPLFADDTETTQ